MGRYGFRQRSRPDFIQQLQFLFGYILGVGGHQYAAGLFPCTLADQRQAQALHGFFCKYHHIKSTALQGAFGEPAGQGKTMAESLPGRYLLNGFSCLRRQPRQHDSQVYFIHWLLTSSLIYIRKDSRFNALYLISIISLPDKKNLPICTILAYREGSFQPG